MQTTWRILTKTETVDHIDAVLDEEGNVLFPAVDNNIVITEVEYAFDDHDPIVISVTHFKPESDDDILIGIQNRAISERRNRYGINITL
jgi:hypothetical protein